MGLVMEEAGGIDKALARTVETKVVFSKEGKVMGSWWTSHWGGCGPRKEEAEMTLRFHAWPPSWAWAQPGEAPGQLCLWLWLHLEILSGAWLMLDSESWDPRPRKQF